MKTTSSKEAKYGKQNGGSIFEARAGFTGWKAGNVTDKDIRGFIPILGWGIGVCVAVSTWGSFWDSPPLPVRCLCLQLMCSSVQKALFEEEDHVKKLQQKVATLEKRNRQLRERVKKVKRSLRQARKKGRHLELANQKLSEKLAAGALPHINARGPVRAPYLRG